MRTAKKKINNNNTNNNNAQTSKEWRKICGKTHGWNKLKNLSMKFNWKQWKNGVYCICEDVRSTNIENKYDTKHTYMNGGAEWKKSWGTKWKISTQNSQKMGMAEITSIVILFSFSFLFFNFFFILFL